MSVQSDIAFLSAEMRRIARKGWLVILAYVVFAAAPFFFVDYYAPEEVWPILAATLFSCLIGYPLTLGLLRAGGYLPGGNRGGLGAYLLLFIIIGLLSGLAMLLFILPGLYLTIRWLPAYARALASSDSPDEAMRWSWEQTGSIQSALVALFLIPFMMIVISIGITIIPEVYASAEGDMTDAMIYFTSNILFSLATVAVTLQGIATYALLTGHMSELEDVFS